MVRLILPVRVGTATLVPNAASHGASGTVMIRLCPSTSNKGCGANLMIRYRSPLAPPPTPGAPWPLRRMRSPSVTPAGIFTFRVLTVSPVRWPAPLYCGTWKLIFFDSLARVSSRKIASSISTSCPRRPALRCWPRPKGLPLPRPAEPNMELKKSEKSPPSWLKLPPLRPSQPGGPWNGRPCWPYLRNSSYSARFSGLLSAS
ncbi:hypothetical protein D3C86_1679800 [compost metagenome]